ncbi:glycosyltransferase [Myxococcota bacterium]|nr:glycosyltransferase [Myxococcota bacterium]
MRVLHVLDISVPLLAGYTHRSRALVLAQRAVGLDPVVVTSVRQKSPADVELEVHDGVRHYRTAPPARAAAERPVVKEALEIAHLGRRILDVAAHERPDVIHAHSSILCGIPAWLAARELGIPCVYEIRAFWEDAAVDTGTNRLGSPKYTAIQTAETALARRADAVIALCEGIRTELVLRGVPKEQLFVVPNGVDTERFSPCTRDESVAARWGLTGKTVVGYLGTFAPFEGVRYLVEALIELVRERDELRGLVVGEGATYELCRAMAERAGVADRIVHPGKVPPADVPGLYSVVDVLAYPRDRQRITELVTPLKPLEAMAMGKAVVVSDVGGLLELVEDGVTGLVHRAEDPSDLAQKLRRLADDPGLRARLGAAARAHVVRERRWTDLVQRHTAVYAHAQARAPRRRWAAGRHLHGLMRPW